MKKFLSLIILSCLVFGLTAITAAKTTVYLDVWGNGNYQYDSKSEFEAYENGILDYTDTYKTKADGDLSGYTLGFESTFDKFKVGFEYGINSSELYGKTNGIKNDYK